MDGTAAYFQLLVTSCPNSCPDNRSATVKLQNELAQSLSIQSGGGRLNVKVPPCDGLQGQHIPKCEVHAGSMQGQMPGRLGNTVWMKLTVETHNTGIWLPKQGIP